MRVLVTGGSGYLGTALCRQFVKSKANEVYASFHTRQPKYGRGVQLDLTDDESISNALEIARPEMVIHTAYSNKPDEVEDVIVVGTRRLAERCSQARFIFISSEWVFDGSRGPYTEKDKATPNSEYGRTKLKAEGIVEELCVNAVTVRSALISGTEPLPPRWQTVEAKLKAGEKVTFYSNEIRNPIHVDDIAAGIIEVARSDYKGLIHIGGPRYMSRLEEAQMFVRWRGLPEELIKSALSDGKNRPLNCSLNAERFRSMFKTRLRWPEEYWKTVK